MEGRTDAVGPVPAAEVWTRYAVPARWPEWAPQIRRVEASTARLVAGTTGHVVGPLGVRVAFRVVAVDETARTWAWDVRLGPVGLHLTHGVEVAPQGCRTTLTVQGRAVVVAAYLPLARIALHRLVHLR